MNKDNTPSMELREIIEACKDKTHPRHNEAIKESEKLAKSFALRMAEYKKAYTQNMAPTLSEVKKSLSSLNSNPIKAPPQIDQLMIDRITAPQALSTVNKQQVPEGIDQALQERTGREQQKHELAEKQYEAMAAMAANIKELREQQAQSTKKDSHKANWNLTLVALTLLATIVSLWISYHRAYTGHKLPDPHPGPFKPVIKLTEPIATYSKEEIDQMNEEISPENKTKAHRPAATIFTPEKNRDHPLYELKALAEHSCSDGSPYTTNWAGGRL